MTSTTDTRNRVYREQYRRYENLRNSFFAAIVGEVADGLVVALPDDASNDRGGDYIVTSGLRGAKPGIYRCCAPERDRKYLQGFTLVSGDGATHLEVLGRATRDDLRQVGAL